MCKNLQKEMLWVCVDRKRETIHGECKMDCLNQIEVIDYTKINALRGLSVASDSYDAGRMNKSHKSMQSCKE